MEILTAQPLCTWTFDQGYVVGSKTYTAPAMEMKHQLEGQRSTFTNGTIPLIVDQHGIRGGFTEGDEYKSVITVDVSDAGKGFWAYTITYTWYVPAAIRKGESFLVSSTSVLTNVTSDLAMQVEPVRPSFNPAYYKLIGLPEFFIQSYGMPGYSRVFMAKCRYLLENHTEEGGILTQSVRYTCPYSSTGNWKWCFTAFTDVLLLHSRATVVKA